MEMLPGLKISKWSLIALCVYLFFESSASAASINDRLIALEEENKLLRELVLELKDRLEILEQEGDKGTSPGLSKSASSLETEGPDVKSSKDIPEDLAVWLPSLKSKFFKLGGEFELEYVDTQQDQLTDNSFGRFQIDKFTLKPHIRISENITLEGLLLFKPEKGYLSEIYAIFSDLPFNTSLKVGLDDRFINEKPNRRTEAFPLIDTAFARDDQLGITLSGKQMPLYWHLSFTNGLALGEQGVSEDKSYKMIHDNRQTTDGNAHKEFGFGLGIKHIFAKKHLVDFMGFGYINKLGKDDIAFLQGVTGYGVSDEDKQYRYGAYVSYQFDNFYLGGKIISARDGILDRDGWFAQASYKFPLRNKTIFSSIEPFIRYGRLNIDLPHSPADSLTWGREMTTLAILAEFRKNLMLKTEYYLNDEDTGGNDVNNNEFLMQLEMKF